MRILRHYEDVPAEACGGVMALGNFDGVHRGHQAVIGRAAETARAVGAPLGVITFEPHPRSFFAPDAPPFRLTPFRTKANHLESLGADILAALHFDRALSEMSAEDFVEKVLVGAFKVRHVVVGYDFIFGHRRRGDTGLLARMAAEHGFGLTVVDPVGEGEAVYSSTRIRNALTAGRPFEAAELLGHWWEVSGHVAAGDRRGRTIGFPTANVGLEDYVLPAFGVYAVRAGLVSGDGVVWHDAVANLGRRPTFDKQDVLLEVHLFDFDGDLYGRQMRVAFIGYIRDERKFDGLEALKAQIEADCESARRILADPRNAMSRYPVRDK